MAKTRGLTLPKPKIEDGELHLPAWMWTCVGAIAGAVIAWAIRIEVANSEQRTRAAATQELATATAAKVEAIATTQIQNAHAVQSIEKLTEELKALRHGVTTLTVEVANLKLRLAQTAEDSRDFPELPPPTERLTRLSRLSQHPPLPPLAGSSRSPPG